MLTAVEAAGGGLKVEGSAVSGVLWADGADWMAGTPKGLKFAGGCADEVCSKLKTLGSMKNKKCVS